MRLPSAKILVQRSLFSSTSRNAILCADMRIVHISQQDDESGGFKAAYRLHTALTRAGHDSRMVVLAKTTRDPSVIPVARLFYYKQDFL